jgi:outer membrane cobalamin receptor
VGSDGEALLNRLDLVAGLEHRRQWYRQWYGADEDPLRSRRTTSAFAGLTAGLAEDRLQLFPAWRWQRNTDDFPPLPILPHLPEETGVRHERDDVSPSVGALWEVASNRLFLQTHASRSVRVPTWIELFGHRGGIDGNRDLEPELIEAVDLGLVLQSDSGATYARLTAFHAETEQAIIFVQNSPGSSKARNIGRTRSRGMEWEGGLENLLRLRWNANLTWQNARDRSGDDPYHDNHLPYLSDLTGWLKTSLVTGQWEGWAEWFYESEKYRDRANTELNKAPARHLVHLGATRTFDLETSDWASLISVTAEVHNLFDDDTYDVEQFPLPGRSWQLSVRIAN